jgi:hypothetical protein
MGCLATVFQLIVPVAIVIITIPVECRQMAIVVRKHQTVYLVIATIATFVQN